MDEFSFDLNSFININDKGSDTIVFQIGSHSIKFGLASQLNPFIIPNVIAHLNKSSDELNNQNINEKFLIKQRHIENDEIFLTNINSLEQEILKKMSKLEHKLKTKNKNNLPKTYTNIKVNKNKSY